MLVIESLSASYGGADVLRHISLHVRGGETLTVLGANTAGKTTLLRSISGLMRRVSGSITFEGVQLIGRAAHEIPGLGIGHVPEGRHLFSHMSALDNLMMGAYATRRCVVNLQSRVEGVLALFPRLAPRLRQLAGSLSGGEQQMLAIGRALMGSPKLLLLDEPSIGLAPKVCQELHAAIREVNHRGVAALMAEQNAASSLTVADRACVIESGRIVLSGEAAVLRGDPAIRRAYLGV